MRKFLNDPADVVADSLRGVAAAHGDLVRVDHEQRMVVRADAPVAGKVGLVSGGGSGHEPLHAGYVGPGMLDAACAGEIFTSPVPDEVAAATRAVDAGAGVLHVVKNYTGDVMNFEMAAELVAADSQTQVSTVLVEDDVAVRDSLYTAGRRGMGTTVLVEKIAGAAAEEGRRLPEVADVGQRVAAGGRSMGVALAPCTVPSAGAPTFDLPDGEMELGIGIHGEPGRERAPLATAAEVAQALVDPVLEDLPAGEGRLLAMVNGMGGTALIELYLMFEEVRRLLDAAGLTVDRCLVGNYITSLEMAGCSLTVLAVDDELLRLWDAPVRTAGLRWGA